MKKQFGFAGAETVLLLIVGVLIVGMGWYIWDANKKTQNTYDQANLAASSGTLYTKKKTTTSQAKDPTANWTAYSSTTGKYSLKYPKTWVTAQHQENCPSTLMLGVNSDIVGKCGSDFAGEIWVYSSKGDNRSDYRLSSTRYTGIKKESITIGGIAGEKESGTFKAPPTPVVGPADKTKTVVYIFYTNGTTYEAMYQQYPNWPDALSDFNLMVTRTLKFSAS